MEAFQKLYRFLVEYETMEPEQAQQLWEWIRQMLARDPTASQVTSQTAGPPAEQGSENQEK